MDERILKSIGLVIMLVAVMIPLIVLVSRISTFGAVLLCLSFGVGAFMFLIGDILE